MRAPRFCTILMALLGGVLAAGAQLPAARISWVFPAGARAGSTNEVSLAGSDLDEPAGLIFSDARILATPRADGAPVFTVIVPPEVSPGRLDVRFAGRFGLSNPRAFMVGSLPEQTVPATQTSPSAAFPLPLDTIVHGRVPPASSCWFRFDAHHGQRLIVRLQARELDSRLVPDLAVLTPGGRELRIARRSSWLDVTVPEDGPLLLRVNDQTYRGGDDYIYRLEISSRPQVDFALPLTLTAGITPQATLFGRNLPGSIPAPFPGPDGTPLEMLDVPLCLADSLSPSVPLASWALLKPAAAVLSGELISASPCHPVSMGETTSLAFIRTSFPSRWSITNGFSPVTSPCDFSGLFPRRGEVSGVTFEAKKDDVFWIEVFSERLGFNTDPHLILQRVTRTEQGEEKVQDLQEFADSDPNLGGREFDTTSRDATGRWKAPEDGTYRIRVRDLYRGSPYSTRLPYRLQIRPETPDFRLAVFPLPPPRRDDNDRQIHLWTPVLRRGATLPLRLIAFRRDGFDGPIDIHVEELPQGVTASNARIPAGQSATTLLLTASTEAPASQGIARISGQTKLGDHVITREAMVSSGRWHIPDWDQERGTPRFTDALRVAVVAAESIPVALAPAAPNPFEVAAKTKLRIPVDITRHADFPGAFKLKPFGHPTLDKAKEIDVPEKATNVVVELDLNDSPLPEGEHVLHFEATVTGRYRNNPEAAEASEKAKPKDVSLRVYSPGLTVRVTPPTKA